MEVGKITQLTNERIFSNNEIANLINPKIQALHAVKFLLMADQEYINSIDEETKQKLINKLSL